MTEQEKQEFLRIANELEEVMPNIIPTSTRGIMLRENLDGWLSQLASRIRQEIEK